VQLDSIKTRVESAPGVCNQRLKLKCDEPLSNGAFNFNLRRYNSGGHASVAILGRSGRSKQVHAASIADGSAVGRCRLSVSKPELKARLVSALETNI
jgi:hypothetical protein